MTYMLLDKTDYLGDFASGGGVEEMLALPNKPNLKKFINQGKIDTKKMALAVAKEVEDVPELKYIADMLLSANPPIIITDGVIDIEPEEESQLAEQTVIPPSEEKTTGDRWFFIKTVDQEPYVLSTEAVRKRWMPPLGVSALPKKIRNAIPTALRYWNAKTNSQAVLLRDELAKMYRKGEVKLPIGENEDV